MSDSVRPHRWQPTRLPRPWDSPGKNSGVGCHFLLQWMKVKSESEVAQWCPTLSDPMDCSLPGSSIHGIFQARVLEWGAIAFSKIFCYRCWKSSGNMYCNASLWLLTFMHWRRKWQPTPVFLPGENPRDGGAWWATVYGVAQSRTRLKRLSSSGSIDYCLFKSLLKEYILTEIKKMLTIIIKFVNPLYSLTKILFLFQIKKKGKNKTMLFVNLCVLN